MSYPENNQADRQRAELAALVDSAIGGDVLTDSGGGFVAVMAKGNPNIKQDIPAAFDMYALLSHFLQKLPIYAVTLEEADALLAPAVLFDEPAGRIVLLIPVEKNELDAIAFWVAEGIRSNTVRAMGGILALPFSIETHDDVRHLIPEWFAAFYVDGSEDHCIPSLTFRSVTLDERFGDWVAIAFERMRVFGLPCEAASNGIRQETTRPRHT